MIVECINDSDRPSDIPISLWVKKGEKYTVTNEKVDMHGVKYYTLSELDLESIGSLYKGYAANRFKFLSPSIDLVLEDSLSFFG